MPSTRKASSIPAQSCDLPPSLTETTSGCRRDWPCECQDIGCHGTKGGKIPHGAISKLSKANPDKPCSLNELVSRPVCLLDLLTDPAAFADLHAMAFRPFPHAGQLAFLNLYAGTPPPT